MSSEINLALIGASGVVGKKIISLLEKKNVKVKNLKLKAYLILIAHLLM
jgi:aspartate-semialdehyde dehydrogenase